jgi:hypothetical protein
LSETAVAPAASNDDQPGHIAKAGPARYERAALRWLQRFIAERLPPLTEVALATSALAELRHGRRNAGAETLQRLLRRR